MRPLSLDYQRPTLTQHWVGIAVLVAMLFGAIQLGFYYQNISGEVARLRTLAAKIERKLHPERFSAKPSAAEAQQNSSAIKTANEIIMQLNLPWSNLFTSLEKANNSNIALLGIEPDAKNGIVRISGEAKDAKSLFAYIRLLQENKSISGVYLKHQQVQEQDPEKPIRFSLDATWM